MSELMVSIFSVCLAKPVSAEQVERRGMVLYICLPCCAPDSSECSHYLAILGICGRINSDRAFNRLAAFGCYSYQWLSYYMREVSHA